MAKAKKTTMEPTPTTEAVPTEQVVELAAPAGLDLSADDLGFGTLREPEASYSLGDETPASDTAEDDAPTETPETPDVPEMPSPEIVATIDDVPESAPAHPYEDKPETTNRCPYCNLRLALVPPNMVNPETGRTYYRQSCPSCPYVERVDEATKRVYHVEWPIHK